MWPEHLRPMPWRAACLCAVLLLPGLFAACRSLDAVPQPLRVMTLNVRLPLDTDGPDRWALRRDVMARVIDAANPDLIGTQELMRTQADDLASRLPQYGWFGTGRRGGDGDEHMGVFYRRDRMRLLESGHFWLSDTPEVPGSISWGHPFPRMVTWGLFERRTDGLRLHLFNTHLPYRAEDGGARLRGAELILDRVVQLADGPVIVLGDFNDAPGSAVHRRLTSVLHDARERASRADGPEGTFHGFTGKPGTRIDWVLYRGLQPRTARTLSSPAGGRHVSDHFPVMVEFDVPAD